MPKKQTNTQKNTTKSATKKRTTKTTKQKKSEIHRAWSIVIFAVGAFLFAMAIVPGENVWAITRQALLGFFGTMSYIIPFLIMYIAVLTAADKPIVIKSIQGVILVLLISAGLHIFLFDIDLSKNAFENISEMFTLAQEGRLSGGVISAVISLPMLYLTGKTASIVTIVILAIVLFMFFADITPYDVYSKTKDTAEVQKQELSKQLEENKKQRQIKQEQKQKIKQEKQEQQMMQNIQTKKNLEIDFDIDDEPSSDVFGSYDDISNNVKDIKTEDEKIEDIVKRFKDRQQSNIPVDDKAALAQIKKENSLTQEEKDAIVPLSDDENNNNEQTKKAYIYKHPPLSLFSKDLSGVQDVEQELKTNAQILIDTLSSFGVQAKIMDISRGPSVTRYEIQPLAGVKISKITNLADDIALNLAASGVRIEAPIPNKAAVGIEIPNQKGSVVNIRTIFQTKKFQESQSPLTIALGMDIAGNEVVADLTRMPHLLIAGSTGSGKSVCVNTIITSFLYKTSPEDLKLILIDPKVVELLEYNGIPHLLMPVVTEPKKAAGALGSAVAEMEKRYRLFAENSARDIKSYNEIAKNNPELEHMPYIVVIIDELADLMMSSGKEVEDYIARLAQKARAAGIHLIVATQRPSVDVITGLIKTNIPSRIAFAVSSQIDSRTILDGGGAEKLLGMGDMLFLPTGSNKPVRIQGAYVKDKEISKVIEYVKQDFNPVYNQDMIDEMENLTPKDKKAVAQDGSMPQDEMLYSAIDVVVDMGQASTSLLQRRLRLGYSRAARIVDEMEEMGIVGPSEGSKPRQVLISKNQWLEMKLNSGE